MASTTRWIIDTAWTAVTFATGDLNSLTNGGGALSTAAITNGTALDQYADISFVVTNGATATTAASYITIYLLPLNQDGTHYGDNYASSSSTQPAAGYAVGSTGVLTAITSAAVYGSLSFINLPPGDFKLAFGNNLGGTLSSTAALTLKYRSYNTNLNA